MRERFEMHVDEARSALFDDEVSELKWFHGLVCDFAASEVALAIQPRDQSPELIEAGLWLKAVGSGVFAAVPDSPRMAPIIAAELDRLRAEVARLTDQVPRAEEIPWGKLRGGDRTLTEREFVAVRDELDRLTAEVARLTREAGR